MKNSNLDILNSQFNSVMSYISENNPWLYALYEPAISRMHSMLLMKDISDERLEAFKRSLHLVDSVCANAGSHTEEIVNEDLKLFGYLYGIFDVLLDIREYEEEGDEEDD
jgi:hypothetical protein